MTDDQPHDEMRRALSGYNEPPPFPRASLEEALFGAGDRAGRHSPMGRRFRRIPATGLAAGIAVFSMGVAAGSLLQRQFARDGQQVAESRPTPAAADSAAAVDIHRVVWF